MTPFAQSLTTLISLGVILADICIVILALIYFFGSPKNKLGMFVSKNALVLSTVISIGAMIGSLLYSSIIGFVPCELCWWQRIFLFSQAVIFFVAWIKGLKTKHKNPDSSL